jgi:hypothetical protein
MNWVRRLKRVFAIDMEKCAQCGGRVRIIAAIEDPEVIEKILRHLGLEERERSASEALPSRTPKSSKRSCGICRHSRHRRATLCRAAHRKQPQGCLTEALRRVR